MSGEAIVVGEPLPRTIRSKAKLLLHGMKSLCYGDPAAFNRETLGNQEDHHGLAAPGKFEAERFPSMAQEWPLTLLPWSVVLPRSLRILLLIVGLWGQHSNGLRWQL